EGCIPDGEPHPVELPEDRGEWVCDLRVDHDLADVGRPVEAVVAEAEDAELRHPDGAAAVPLARGHDCLLLRVREARDAGVAGGVMRGGGGDREDSAEDDYGDALHERPWCQRSSRLASVSRRFGFELLPRWSSLFLGRGHEGPVMTQRRVVMKFKSRWGAGLLVAFLTLAVASSAAAKVATSSSSIQACALLPD